MKRKLFSYCCYFLLLVTAIFTSCKQDVPAPEMATISYVTDFGLLDKNEKIVGLGYRLKAEDLPKLTHEGYTFDNWYINKNEAFVGTEINKDTVLVAKWVENIDNKAPNEVEFGEIISADGKATINWTNPTDSDFFGVMLSMTPSEGTLKKPVILGNDVTSFNIDGLRNGTIYTLKINTLDKSMNKSNGESTFVIVEDNTPPSTTPLFVDSIKDGKVDLHWLKPNDSDLDRYRLSCNPAAGSLSVPITLDKDILKYTVTDLTIGTEYAISLETIDKKGNSSEKSTINVTMKYNNDDTPPGEITWGEITAKNGNAYISWFNPNDVDFRGIELSSSPAEGTLENPVILYKEVSSFNISGLTDGKSYTFKIRTLDNSNNYSNGVIKTVRPIKSTEDTTPPAEVTQISCSPKDGYVELSWKKPADSDLKGFKISLEPAIGTLRNPVIVNKDVQMFAVNGLAYNTPYKFKIQTFDKSLNFSNGQTKETIIKMGDTTAPDEVTSMEITANDGRALVEWTNPITPDFTGVVLSMEPAVGTLINPVMLGKDVNTFTVDGLTNETSYTFKLVTFDNSMNKSKGTIRNATPKNTSDKKAPGESELTVVSAFDSSVKLSWTKPNDSDLKGYKLSSEPAAGTLINPVILDKDVLTFTVSELVNNNTYKFTLQTFDNNLNYSNGTSVSPKVSISDTIAPGEVTFGDVKAENGRVILNWTNPTEDADFKGLILSMNPAEGSLTKNITLDTETTSFIIDGLTNNNKYTFTIVTFDKNLNKSNGRSIEATPIGVSDTSAPNPVTDLTATNNDGIITLSWKDPTDTTDLLGIEISYAQKQNNLNTRSLVPLEKNSIIVAPKVQHAEITNLVSHIPYVFTVKSVKLNGTKSSPETVEFTPIKPIRINLTQTKTETTKDPFSVNVEIESSANIETVKYAKGIYNKDYFENDGTIINNIDGKYSFTVSESSIYTVFVKDITGRTEMKTIDINNIDKIASPITNLKLRYEEIKQTIVITWDEPADSTYVGVSLRDSSKEIVYVEKGTTQYEMTNVSQDASYTIYAYSKDKFGNEGKPVIQKIQTLSRITPQFETITLPQPETGTHSLAETIDILVTGTNFVNSNIPSSDYSITCEQSSELVSNADIKVINDKNIKITLKIPKTLQPNTYNLILKVYDSSITADFLVRDTTIYKPGDILLSNGKNVPYKEYHSTLDAKPIAVMCGFSSIGLPLGIAIVPKTEEHKSYLWEYAGYNKEHDITKNYKSINYDPETGNGDKEGCDNHKFMYNEEGVYRYNHAFNYTASYGGGILGYDWFLPSLYELQQIYENKIVVNEALDFVQGAMIKDFEYWSSSQCTTADGKYKTFSFNFKDGKYYEPERDSYHYVFPIRAF